MSFMINNTLTTHHQISAILDTLLSVMLPPWDALPGEIQLMLWEPLKFSDKKVLSRLSRVSRQWNSVFHPLLFKTLRIKHSDFHVLVNFSPNLLRHVEALVYHLEPIHSRPPKPLPMTETKRRRWWNKNPMCMTLALLARWPTSPRGRLALTMVPTDATSLESLCWGEVPFYIMPVITSLEFRMAPCHADETMLGHPVQAMPRLEWLRVENALTQEIAMEDEWSNWRILTLMFRSEPPSLKTLITAHPPEGPPSPNTVGPAKLNERSRLWRARDLRRLSFQLETLLDERMVVQAHEFLRPFLHPEHVIMENDKHEDLPRSCHWPQLRAISLSASAQAIAQSFVEGPRTVEDLLLAFASAATRMPRLERAILKWPDKPGSPQFSYVRDDTGVHIDKGNLPVPDHVMERWQELGSSPSDSTQ